MQVTRVGKYKSAVEPFILTKMSDADREETQKLIDDLWGDFVTAVSRSRPIDPAAFQQLVDTDGYILPAARARRPSRRQARLLRRRAQRPRQDRARPAITPASRFPSSRSPSAITSTPSRTPRLLGERGSDNVVAVLYLEGEIVDGWGELTNIGGDRFAAELRDLRKDDDVKAVVLRVNSPGGSAYASEVIQREIIDLKAKKPVIVSMGNYAASGGYWVSTYGDRIFAEPNTLTGSIGVFGMFLDIQKLAQ